MKRHRRGTRGWLGLLASLPGALAGLLPLGICAACWPVHAGLLSSLGMGFLFDRAYLLPITFAALGVALGALAYRASSRRGYGPLGLGALAAAALLVGKFVLGWRWPAYAGVGLLLGASVWNAWPRRRGASCPACDPLAAPPETSTT